MTPHTFDDRRTICRIQLTGEGRWIGLALSLEEAASDSRFLVTSERLLHELTGVDEGSRAYGITTWQGGVISGARYAFRALKVPLRRVGLHELRGQLGSGDVWAISSAAALAIARLLARSPEFPLDLGGWAIEEELHGPPAVEAVTPIAPAAARQSEILPGRVEDRPVAPGRTSSNGDA